MKVRHRGTVVTVYRKTKKYPSYRIAYRGDGGRVVRGFKTLAEAMKAAKAKARELHAGNHVGTSLPKAAAHAYKFATDKLAQLCRDLDARTPDPAALLTSLSLEEAITEYVEAKRALGSRRLIEAITGFLGTVAQVRRVKVRAAVDEYLKERKLLTVPPAEGKRPALSPKFHYQDELRLGRLADALVMDVADLTKDHFELFFREHLGELGAKSRNHYRGSFRKWLVFCVARDYLPAAHRLLEARAMQNEKAEGSDIEIYTAKELTALLLHADPSLRPALVIGALAGLRTQEVLRLEWSDVWRRAEYIEITRGKAKTRQRRLVPICPALTAWLQPHRDRTDGRVWEGKENYFHQLSREAGEAAGIARKDNALRHSFISYRLRMPVNSTHPDYDANLVAWSRARDVISGEDAVRSAGTRYLPRLDSQTDEESL